MLRHTIRLAIVALVASSAMFGVAKAATVFDLANDFSITNNGSPNNLWGYGAYTSGLTPSSYTPFTVTATGVFGALDVWSFAGSDPNLEKNVTGSANSGCCDITWPAGEVAFGPFGGPTVARWTAPTSSLYDVSATFTPIQANPTNTSPDGYVYLGSTQQVDLPLGSPFVGSNYHNAALFIAAGQTLDFVVWGGNGNNKTTEVQATITPVPEPASLTLFAVAGVVFAGMGWSHRRRRFVG